MSEPSMSRPHEPQNTERLFEEARPRLIRVALSLGVDPDSAADLAQESLLSAHRNFHRFDPEKGSFEGWTSIILLRRARNLQRSRWRRWRMLRVVRASAPYSNSAGSRAVEARITLQRLLRELTDRQREVIALYEIAGLSAGETAAILDLTPAGVRSTARDARRRLTEFVRREDDGRST
jgi:RNA polymerase sigma-70 factor (ECF subfamily)